MPTLVSEEFVMSHPTQFALNSVLKNVGYVFNVPEFWI